jgi:hypothetical protein
MTPQYVFDIWSPPGGLWSPWVKPVLFAHVKPLAYYGEVQLPAAPVMPWLGRREGREGQAALVIDLPGELAVVVALHAARAGYRPVPLYNAVPGSGGSAAAVCDVAPIVAALSVVTPELDGLNLPYAAPPAFMLDAARRCGSGVQPQPGMFDNRSVSLPTDFPSANRLLSQGIRRVMLIQTDRPDPQEDLAHTLLRWQQAGIAIESVMPNDPVAQLVPITVRKPFLYRQLWQRLLATMGLRRSPLGGFGGVLPIPSSSG